MGVGFEIKGSNLKSFVNRLDLFKVLIVSLTSFLQECSICSSDSSSSFLSFPSVITSTGCLENSETIYSTDSGRDWLVPSRKCTSRNVELNGSFFIRSIFVKLFQYFILYSGVPREGCGVWGADAPPFECSVPFFECYVPFICLLFHLKIITLLKVFYNFIKFLYDFMQ